jgi:hypothetical protein
MVTISTNCTGNKHEVVSLWVTDVPPEVCSDPVIPVGEAENGLEGRLTPLSLGTQLLAESIDTISEVSDSEPDSTALDTIQEEPDESFTLKADHDNLDVSQATFPVTGSITVFAQLMRDSRQIVHGPQDDTVITTLPTADHTIPAALTIQVQHKDCKHKQGVARFNS